MTFKFKRLFFEKHCEQFPVVALRSSETSSRYTTNRFGTTLIEVILALGLTVVVMLLIGGLLNIYQGNLDLGRDNIRQARVAKATLNIIADDLRSVIRNVQQNDAETLRNFLSSTTANAGSGGGTGGGGGGGGSTNITGGNGGGSSQATGTNATNTAGGNSAASMQTNSSTGGANANSGTGAGSSSGANGGMSGGMGTSSSSTSASGTGTDTGTSATTTNAAAPAAGIYGTESAIDIDVSRPPRVEEYMAEVASPISGTLNDLPSDGKTISYYIQAPRSDGIQDPLMALAGTTAKPTTTASVRQNGGLVRRSIDRGVYKWASENGKMTQITRTGQLLAPEILAMSFSYFDGKQWATKWDGSSQGIPWAIKIVLYMQHANAAKNNPIAPGVSIQALTTAGGGSSGIEMYSLIVNIPGSQSLVTPMEQAEAAAAASSGTSSTSSLGF